jgi:ABC-type branched-subunit amino acid transport system ATPase component
VILDNPSFNGGPIHGTVVAPPTLFGLAISPVTHPQRYATVAIVLFVLAALLTANVRRGRAGRRLLSVRTNERAASALGVSVVGAKLYAFALATAIAASGGILLAFVGTTVNFDQYQPVDSIMLVFTSFIGGIGFVAGALVGATFTVGSAEYEILSHFFSVGSWVILIGGALAVVTATLNPDGVAGVFAVDIVGKIRARSAGSAERAVATLDVSDAGADRPRQSCTTLEVRGLRVVFGGVVALDDVDLTLRSGEVVGLIGPNGAGKSTLVDAVSGLNRRYGGTITLDGRAIDALSAHERSRAGVSRSFQNLELFEDLTVMENLQAAADRRDVGAYFTDMVHPGRPRLSASSAAAVASFNLRAVLLRRPEELDYGQRRLVAVARAMAGAPKVLMLDEPAAGLDEVRTRELGELIRRLARDWNIAILLIEHDVPLVMATCDRITVLNFGHQIAYGRPEEIRTDQTVIDAYIGNHDATETTQKVSSLTAGQE